MVIMLAGPQVTTNRLFLIACIVTVYTDETMEVPKEAIQMLRDPVTGHYNGQALVQMQSAEQACWVKNDLNDMIFSMGYGPRPLEASVAKSGKPCFKTLHKRYALIQQQLNVLYIASALERLCCQVVLL